MLDAEVAARRAAAVDEKLVSGDTEGLLSALPMIARRGDRRRVGRWLDADEDPRFAGRVLLDGEGRPLLHEPVEWGGVNALWRYEDGRTEEVRFWSGEPLVTWIIAGGAVGVDDSERWAERWT